MKSTLLVLSLLIVGFLGHTALAASAQDAGGAPQPSAAAAAAQDNAPVPVPEMTEQARRYYESGNVLWVVNTLWGLAVPLLFLFTGLSAGIRTWATKLGRKWFFVIAIYFIVFTLINSLLNLPLAYYQEFVREHAYGLSNQSLDKWIDDTVKGLAVGIVIGVLFLWVPYLLLSKSPRRRWLYTGVLTAPFLFLVMLVSPIWIDPLFNKFGPMKDKALETSILTLADYAGIEGGRVYEVDKSVDTKTVNAYVTGFMDTKRIVLWDTIIARLDRPELLFVMGHEMGHYVLGHVIKGILFFSAVIMLLLYLAHRSARAILAAFSGRFGFFRLSDVASLPLLILLVNLATVLVMPGVLAYTRYQEHESDRFGLEITRRNRPAALAFVKLQQENLANPRPGMLYKLWRSTHPPVGERLDFCNSYRPWEKGEPLVYGSYFRGPQPPDSLYR